MIRPYVSQIASANAVEFGFSFDTAAITESSRAFDVDINDLILS